MGCKLLIMLTSIANKTSGKFDFHESVQIVQFHQSVVIYCTSSYIFSGKPCLDYNIKHFESAKQQFCSLANISYSENCPSFRKIHISRSEIRGMFPSPIFIL